MEDNSELLAIMKEIQQNVMKISSEVDDIKKEISEIKGNQATSNEASQAADGQSDNEGEVKTQEEITNEKLEGLFNQVKIINEDIKLIKKDLVPLKQGTAMVIKDIAEIKNDVISIKLLDTNMDNKLGIIYNLVYETDVKSKASIDGIVKDYKNSFEKVADLQEEIINDMMTIKNHFSIKDNHDYKINAKIIKIK